MSVQLLGTRLTQNHRKSQLFSVNLHGIPHSLRYAFEVKHKRQYSASMGIYCEIMICHLQCWILSRLEEDAHDFRGMLI